MTDVRVPAWIQEVLHDDGPASPLAIAQQVWHRHEQEIRASGDLLYTWQIDLHDAAESLVAAGSVAVDAHGRWALAGAAPAPARRAWGEDEIGVAVAAYVALLRAEHTGRPLRRNNVVDEVRTRTGRTPAQVDALMANISAVVQEHGYQPLAAFAPRSNVPPGVRPAVAAALEEPAEA